MPVTGLLHIFSAKTGPSAPSEWHKHDILDDAVQNLAKAPPQRYPNSTFFKMLNLYRGYLQRPGFFDSAVRRKILRLAQHAEARGLYELHAIVISFLENMDRDLLRNLDAMCDTLAPDRIREICTALRDNPTSDRAEAECKELQSSLRFHLTCSKSAPAMDSSYSSFSRRCFVAACALPPPKPATRLDLQRFLGNRSYQPPALATATKLTDICSAWATKRPLDPAQTRVFHNVLEQFLERDAGALDYLQRHPIKATYTRVIDGVKWASTGEYASGTFASVKAAVPFGTSSMAAIRVLPVPMYDIYGCVEDHFNEIKFMELFAATARPVQVAMRSSATPGVTTGSWEIKQDCVIPFLQADAGDFYRTLDTSNRVAVVWKIIEKVGSLAASFQHSGYKYSDYKEKHFMCDTAGEIHLVNFGFMQPLEKSDEYAGDLAGTLDYLAPEQLNQLPYNGPKADCWSFGVALLRILLGPEFFRAEKQNFDGLEALQKIYASELFSRENEDMRGLFSGAYKQVTEMGDEQLAELLFRAMMHPDPAQRATWDMLRHVAEDRLNAHDGALRNVATTALKETYGDASPKMRALGYVLRAHVAATQAHEALPVVKPPQRSGERAFNLKRLGRALPLL